MTITLDGTTGISSVDGSAASPSVRGSDSNSGIVYAADTVSISTGGTERLEVDSSGNIDIPDNGKIRLGGSGDLELYHSGTHSYIVDAGTGGLNINVDNLWVNKADGSETCATFNADGAVELYFNHVKTFETLEYGGRFKRPSGGATDLEILGCEGQDAGLYLAADDGDDNADKWRLVASADGNIYLNNYTSGSWEINLRATGNGGVDLYYDNSKKLYTYSEGIKIDGYIKAHPNISDSHWGDNTQNWSLIGNNDNGTAALIVEHSGDSQPYGIEVYFSDNTPDDHTRYFYWAGDTTTARFRVYADGDVWNHDDAYSGSDQTLKENIVDATPKLEDLKKLKVRNFNWKADYFPEKSKKKQLGFIAQEVEEVFPALVTEHDIAGGSPTDSNHTPVMKKAIKQAWSPIIIKAMQELIEKVETLEAKVAALEAG